MSGNFLCGPFRCVFSAYLSVHADEITNHKVAEAHLVQFWRHYRGQTTKVECLFRDVLELLRLVEVLAIVEYAVADAFLTGVDDDEQRVVDYGGFPEKFAVLQDTFVQLICVIKVEKQRPRAHL